MGARIAAVVVYRRVQVNLSPMSIGSLFRLILLAALWGGSFLFLRLGVPSFGAGWLIELRVAIAFVFLLLVGHWLGRSIVWRAHWRHYTLMGLFNSAAPFLLFAYAAQSLPASLLSIFNSTAPIWGALLGLLFLRIAVSPSAAVGLMLGVGGVAVLTLGGGASLPAGSALPIIAASLAPVCYAIASTLARRAAESSSASNSASNPNSLGAFENAAGSMGASSILVLPLCLLLPMNSPPDVLAWGSALALGVLCTGMAYLLYFRLISDVGPMKALSVTFLIPIFGTLWGVLFLGETLSSELLLGGGLILAGTLLTTGALRFPSGMAKNE